jgi:MobA-like NTP transferase domain
MPTLVVLAAGISSRFGGGKQLAPVGPHGEALFDYTIYDAFRADYQNIVFVIQKDAEREFETHVTDTWGNDLTVRYAYQNAPRPQRQRPWGTGHAILSARNAASCPFAVVNADDWYPPAGFTKLRNSFATYPGHHALVAYPLSTTPMSEDGGVSRAVCEIADDGSLQSIFEVRDIMRSGNGYVGLATDGSVVALSGSEMVSMNFWGFAESLFDPLAEQFDRFRDAASDESEEEFLIGFAINEQLQAGECRVHVVGGGEAGFGMTYRADRPAVTERIRGLIAGGTYPDILRDGLS